MTKKLFGAFFALLLIGAVSCTKPERGSAAEGWEQQFNPDKDLLPPDDDEPSDPVKDDPGTDEPGDTSIRWFDMIGLCNTWTDVENRDVLDYVELCKSCGINCLSVFNPPREGSKWNKFARDCAEAGIDIEWEEHMMSYLLPRDLYGSHPEYYRMNEGGARVTDANGCPSNPDVLRIVRERAKTIATNYKSTNNRYYCWQDDSGGFCHCPECKNLSYSDQLLMFENAIIKGLRDVNPDAKLAHLAYFNTLEAPTVVKPEEGIFLEFAPIDRDHSRPLSDTWAIGKDGRTHATYIKALKHNVEWFGAEDAMVLEYWLDDSLFSNWDYGNLVKVPWNHDNFMDDVKTYVYYGIKNISCYAFYIDAKYVNKFGYPDCIVDYGTSLSEYKK